MFSTERLVSMVMNKYLKKKKCEIANTEFYMAAFVDYDVITTDALFVVLRFTIFSTFTSS